MMLVLSDDRLHLFTGGTPADLPELRERYRSMARGVSPDGREVWLNWIVRLRPDGRPIGTVQATVVGMAAEVAWIIGIPWQRQGFASEAAEALIAWLDAEGIESISATIRPDHAASAAVARRVGLAPTDDVIEGEVVWRKRSSDSD